MGRDLASHPGRTTLVVLSVAIGVFAVGMIAGTRRILSTGLASTYAATNPPSGTLITTEPFGDPLVESVSSLAEVAEAEGRRRVTVRLRTGPNAFRDLQLTAVPDFDDIALRIVDPESGAWPPPPRTLLLERSARDLVPVWEGDVLTVKTPTGDERQLPVAGIAHDVSQPPAFLEGILYGYVTFETLEWLGEPRSYNELDFAVEEGADDKAHTTEVAALVRDKVEAAGRSVLFMQVPEPGLHPLDSIVSTVLLLLGALGALAVLLSGFLVINTVAALVADQTRQIGVMKAVGARPRQVGALYIVLVLVFGALSLLVALPAGAAGAVALSVFMAGKLNVDLPSVTMPAGVLAVQVLVALVVPVAAAAAPVAAGVRVSVREALTSYGLGTGAFGTSRVDQALRRVTGLPRPVLLALRNTFRRKTRVGLTLTTLGLAGAAFIAVFSVRASMGATLDRVLELWQYDVLVSLDRPYRTERVVEEALRVPGVAAAEGWGFEATRFELADGTDSETVFLFGTPPDTGLLQPDVLRGRWLSPSDENAIVINTKALSRAGDLDVGDTATVVMGGRESEWHVVGVVQAPGPDPFVYVPYEHFAAVNREAGRAGSVLVVTERGTDALERSVASNLERHFQAQGLRVRSVLRISDEIAEAEAAFNILVVLLLIMAVLLAAVGGLGLAGTMSLNVIERTREIGVMRAVGASDAHVMRIVLAEGIIIGLLSAASGAVLAYPLGRLLSDAVGNTFLESPLHYTYALGGVALWLCIVLIISAAASALPARGASGVSVREVLAYE